MRDIYCLPCGESAKRVAAKFEEDYRCVEGSLKVHFCRCDTCGRILDKGQRVQAFTQHPGGAHVVQPWEDEFIQMTNYYCDFVARKIVSRDDYLIVNAVNLIFRYLIKWPMLEKMFAHEAVLCLSKNRTEY